jgi:sporulation protein YlmC with PRC-barrel domain
MYVLINPVIDQVTHLVVREDSFLNSEYIVPVDFVVETVADTIRLRCSKAEMKKMDPFIKTTVIEEKLPAKYSSYYGGYRNVISPYFYWPYVSFSGKVQVPVEHHQIPPGEMAVRRGTRIEATDGYVGHVDEFVVNPENGYITHLVMREEHLWGQKDVIIPVSAMKSIGEMNEDTVVLNIDKHQIESLPTFPVNRRWS